jgi:hypothetical protein
LNPSSPAPARTVATFGFNIPCQRFVITANIARDSRFPIVDEFVLRLLDLGEELPATRIGTFFGFTTSETTTVLADLQARGLVEVVGEAVKLGPAAADVFRAARDGAPQIANIETSVTRLWFDLISRNMMIPERTRMVDHLLELKPSAAAKSMPAGFARDSFDQNFLSFLKDIRGINNPERFSLYSVSDVIPDRFGYVVLSGSTEMQAEPRPRLATHLLNVDLADVAKFRPLSDAMHNAVRNLTEPTISASSLTEFRRLTGDAQLAANINGKGQLDLDAWLRSRDAGSAGRPFVLGASYVERNRAAFVRQVQRQSAQRLKNSPAKRLDLYWYRPAGTSWGVSLDVPHVFTDTLIALKHSLTPHWNLRTTLVGPASGRRETLPFLQLFDRGLLAPASHLTAPTEVIYLEGVAAMVLTRVALSETVTIPVGVVLSSEGDLRRLESGLKLSSGERFDTLWDRSDRSRRS